MRKIAFIFACILFSFVSIHAVKRIDANPINIAFMLAQDTDSASIARTLAYYGYQPQATNTERSSDTVSADTPYSIYTHRNGSTIRYSFNEATKDQPYPHVEVKSRQSSRDIEAILTNLDFQKTGSLYERKNGKIHRSKFTCRQRPQGYWDFHQSRTPIQK